MLTAILHALQYGSHWSCTHRNDSRLKWPVFWVQIYHMSVPRWNKSTPMHRRWNNEGVANTMKKSSTLCHGWTFQYILFLPEQSRHEYIGKDNSNRRLPAHSDIFCHDRGLGENGYRKIGIMGKQELILGWGELKQIKFPLTSKIQLSFRIYEISSLLLFLKPERDLSTLPNPLSWYLLILPSCFLAPNLKGGREEKETNRGWKISARVWASYRS